METSRKRNWQSEQKPHLMLCHFTPCSHRNCRVAPAAEQSSTSIILNLMAEKGSMWWCTPKDSVPAYSCLGQGKTSSYGSFPVTSSWEQNKSTAEGGIPPASGGHEAVCSEEPSSPSPMGGGCGKGHCMVLIKLHFLVPQTLL